MILQSAGVYSKSTIEGLVLKSRISQHPLTLESRGQLHG